jgi:ribosomal protein L37E
MADPTACANGLIAGQGSIYWKEGMASCTACGHNYLHSKKDPCHLCQMEVRLRALEA